MASAKIGRCLLGVVVLASTAAASVQSSASGATAEVRLRIVSSEPGKVRRVPAVIWLEPTAGTSPLPFPVQGKYVLLQKNRMFFPHLQVIPAGAVVQFPNADPFFHNVFSLYEGKRFDLGLYEAGSSKSVTFSREGISYIFCNIHPEMSAVVLALSTPLYAIADTNNAFTLRNIPPGDYKLHIWIEGVPQAYLEQKSRQLHLPPLTTDLGELPAPISRTGSMPHANKFGNDYTTEPRKTY